MRAVIVQARAGVGRAASAAAPASAIANVFIDESYTRGMRRGKGGSAQMLLAADGISFPRMVMKRRDLLRIVEPEGVEMIAGREGLDSGE
jgi:hypothetical protein